MEDKLDDHSKDKILCQTMKMTICDYLIKGIKYNLEILN